MAVINGVTTVFKVIAGQFELVMGIIVLIGLLIQRKKASDIVMGVTKAIVGVLILKQGSTILQAAYKPAMAILQEAFHITGIVTENYSGMAAINTSLAPEILAVVPQIMVLGFVINLLLARFTPLKFVFLTGHTMLAFSTLVAWLFHFFFGVDGVALLVGAGLLCGIYYTVMPAWVYRYSRHFAGDSFTLGHVSGTSAVISSWIGMALGKFDKRNPKTFDDSEEAELKGMASIFTDSTVVTCLLMTIFLGGICLLAGKPYILEQAGSVNWVVFTLELGASFTVGIVVLLTGVRMMIAELVPAFKGISDKLIPNAIPCLDMPVFFPMASFAAILGFIGAFIGEFAGFFILLVTGSSIMMIPGIIATFFDGGIAGVFGYKFGGKKAAVISGLTVGLLQILGGVFFTKMSGLAELGATYGNTDFGTIWIGLAGIMKVIGNMWVFIVVMLAVLAAAVWLLRPGKKGPQS